MKTKKENKQHELLKNRIDYGIYGSSGIEEGARNQMEVAMKLPVAIAGALMRDAHQGYGLPIGGVLATKNAVIPYGVGVDIGCRMALSVYPLGEVFLERNRSSLKRMLIDNTRFGFDVFDRPKDHEVLNASANHEQIHKRIAKVPVEDPLFKVENHHNFAWKEVLENGTVTRRLRKTRIKPVKASFCYFMPPNTGIFLLLIATTLG